MYVVLYTSYYSYMYLFSYILFRRLLNNLWYVDWGVKPYEQLNCSI